MVFNSTKSGAKMVWDSPGMVDGFIEIKHPDGTIAHYTRAKKVRSTVTTYLPIYQHYQWWLLRWVRDPWDNETRYIYNDGEAGDNALIRIEYPTGLHELWNWAPTWTWTGNSGIEVTYIDTKTTPNPTQLTSMTWYMVFENYQSRTHFDGLLKRVYAQASEYVPQPSAGALYQVESKTLAHKVTDYYYGGNGGQGRDVSSVLVYRVPAGTPSQSDAPATQAEYDLREVESITYDTSFRVASQTMTLEGSTISYEYGVGVSRTQDVPPGVTLQATQVTTAHNKVYLDFDPVKNRVYRQTVAPLTSARSGDSDGPAEPTAIITDYYYDDSCVCQKPIQVRQFATGHETNARSTYFEYYADSKLLKKRVVVNPATGGSQPQYVSYEYDYVQTLSSSVLWNAWRMQEMRTPDGTVHYDYIDQLNRIDVANHGTMPSKIKRTLVGVRVQNGENSTATQDIVSHVYPNLVGSTHTTFSGSATLKVQGQPRRIVDSDSLATDLSYDDAGRLTQTDKGDVRDTLAFDAWGLLETIGQNVTSTSSAYFTIEQGPQGQTYRVYSNSVGVPTETKFYFDLWGNPAVELRNNVASDNADPHRHGLAGSARDWTRTEAIWQYSKLMEERVDRRPLDEGEADPFLTQNPLMAVTEYDYTAGGLPQYISNPNGSQTVYEFDGFGTVYKVRLRKAPGVDTGSLVQKYFVNDFLEPVTLVKGDGSDKLITTIERNGAGAVTALVEPSFAVPSGYQGPTSGARWEFVLDQLGRVTESKALDGATILAQRTTTYDQLDRAMKVVNTVHGQGSGAYWAINAFLAGSESRLDFTESIGGKRIAYGYDAYGRLSALSDNFPGSGGQHNHVIYSYKANTDVLQSIVRTDIEGGGTGAIDYGTSYETDVFGRVTAVKVGPSGSELTHTYAYNSLGQVDRYTDPMGRVQEFLPDAMGRLVEHVRVGDGSDYIRNKSIYFDYTGSDSRTKVERYDGLNNVTVTHFDFAGRPFIVQNPGASGVDPTPTTHQAFSTLAVYNSLSRVSDIYDGDGGHTILRQDGAGRLIWRELLNSVPKIATLNTKDVLTRDKLGRIVQTDLLGASGVSGGNLVNTAPVGVEAFQQDSLGRTFEEAYIFALAPLNILRVQSGYNGGDPFRTALNYVDGLSGGNSAPLSMGYTPDAIGRLSQVEWNTAPGSGSPTALVDYTWVGGLRKNRSIHYSGTIDGNTSYQYDAYGRLTQILDQKVVSGGATTSFSQFDYVYDAAGNLKKEVYDKVGGRDGDRFLYDAYHRLVEGYLGVDGTTMGLSDTALASLAYSTTAILTKLTYGLDVANSRTDTTTQFSATSPTPIDYYVQDDTHFQGPSNRYDRVGPNGGTLVTMTYDGRGNMTYDGQYYYDYDYLNRLQAVWRVNGVVEEEGATFAVIGGDSALQSARQEVVNSVPDLLRRYLNEHGDPVFRGRVRASIAGGVIRMSPSRRAGGGFPGMFIPESAELVLHAVYAYDAFNRRIMRANESDPNTYFHTYDGWREVVEYVKTSGQAVPNKEFVWGSRLDELIAYRRKVGSSWETYFIHHGGQDTAARLVNSSGAVVEKYEYDPYGRASVYDDSNNYVGWTSAYGLPFLWKAIRVDAETGLLYMRNRYYSPALGRFLTPDPLGAWGDRLNCGNRQAYVGERPLSYRDPLGLQGEGIIVKSIADAGLFTRADFPERAEGVRNGDYIKMGEAATGYSFAQERTGDPSYGKHNGQHECIITYKRSLQALFYPEHSWIAKGASDDLVNHEIGHIRVVALMVADCAGTMGSRYQAIGIGASDVAALKDALDKAKAAYEEEGKWLQEQYDRLQGVEGEPHGDGYDSKGQTNHSRNEEGQSEWDTFLDEMEDRFPGEVDEGRLWRYMTNMVPGLRYR